ncbi:hypothetical protein EDC63_1473 [Sulfurirhabdus autotrophica]|uniref:Uncharacterized protein n=1 Tax=Sulfurirhabdus autotrophica TaxID=1706046 RepID=A0A4R3XTR6_9PROT|nr:hypothetical protein EDC63_1473 [Sulfurirhabdus autotrophica]
MIVSNAQLIDVIQKLCKNIQPVDFMAMIYLLIN